MYTTVSIPRTAPFRETSDAVLNSTFYPEMGKALAPSNSGLVHKELSTRSAQAALSGNKLFYEWGRPMPDRLAPLAGTFTPPRRRCAAPEYPYEERGPLGVRGAQGHCGVRGHESLDPRVSAPIARYKYFARNLDASNPAAVGPAVPTSRAYLDYETSLYGAQGYTARALNSTGIERLRTPALTSSFDRTRVLLGAQQYY